MSSTEPRVTFVTDIKTPYTVAVMGALAKRVDLTVLFSSESGSRAMEWDLAELPFEHEVLGGLVKRRYDATDLHLSPRLLTALRRTRPDAVIVGGFSFPALYTSIHAALHRVPFMVHSDGTSDSEAGLAAVQRAARAYVVARAAAAIANSRPAAERFSGMGFAPERIFLAPHSTDIAPFAAVGAGRVARPARRLDLLATGRLIPRKGFDRLIRACAAASRRGPQVTLTLVGSGPEEARLRALAAEVGADVRLPGFADQAALPEFFAAADAYAFPTLDDPFGIVVLEAAASGLPVVASPRAGATHELIRDGVSGFVRDPDDLDGFADALVRLAEDPALRQRLGDAAREAAIGRTPESTADGYATAVGAVLAAAPAAGGARA